MRSMSIPLLIFAIFGVVSAAPVLNVDPVSGVQVIDKGIPELSVAKAHLASTLSGGIYTQPPSEEGAESASYTDSTTSGEGWVRIKRRRHLDY